ncbi:hypothetical protein RJT34_02276 [Clitoria ternatea]|uniref:Uncharacterized protein n=1 Tax=Clitoria ternatea TaxID=43366 RepID=A0AAN9KIF9_CLITE
MAGKVRKPFISLPLSPLLKALASSSQSSSCPPPPLPPPPPRSHRLLLLQNHRVPLLPRRPCLPLPQSLRLSLLPQSPCLSLLHDDPASWPDLPLSLHRPNPTPSIVHSPLCLSPLPLLLYYL